jgi:hypothetical protein
MEMLICQEQETKAISQRLQVSYKSKPGKRNSGRKFKVYRSAESAARKSNELYARGIKSKIEPVLTDLYIVNHCGGVLLCQSRLHPFKAAELAYFYSRVDRVGGILLWPSCTKLPKDLQSRLVVADTETEVVS